MAPPRRRSTFHAPTSFPDFNLDDHRAQGAAARAIALGGWEVVVLEQSPSSLPRNRAQLRSSVGCSGRADPGGERESRATLGMAAELASCRFRPAIESYTLAAQDVNGLLFPVAAAWLAAWEHDPT